MTRWSALPDERPWRRRAGLFGFAWVDGGRDGTPIPESERPRRRHVLVCRRVVRRAAARDAGRRPPAADRERARCAALARRLDALSGDRLESLFVLALATGLRRGELLGLRWTDVDLAGRVLFVRQTLQRTDAGLAFAPPKTHRSTRPLPLSGLAVRALEQQPVRQARERLSVG